MEDKDINRNGTEVKDEVQETNVSKPIPKRKVSWQKEMQLKRQSRAFKLIDRRFQQKEELLDGMIMLRKPLQGEIHVNIDFQTKLLQQILEEAMNRWSLNIGFHELRALKSAVGLQASTTDLDTIHITSKYLSWAFTELTKFSIAYSNMAFELMKMGKGEISLPSLAIDLMHLANGYTQMHEPEFLEKAQLQMQVNECEFVTLDDLKWDESKKMQSFFKSGVSANFIIPYNFLNRLNRVSDLMPSTTLNINEIYTATHPSLLTCLIGKSKEEGMINLRYGMNTVKKDILLNSILGTKLHATTLEEYHIDDFVYTYYTKGRVQAFKRILLEEYFNIPDTFVSPTITAAQRRVYNGNVISGEPINLD